MTARRQRHRREAVAAGAVLALAALAEGHAGPLAEGAAAAAVLAAVRPSRRSRRSRSRSRRGPAARSRMIPQDVKVAVAARDQGRCQVCGSRADIQFDHVIPFGSPAAVANLRLLCGTCNRRKSARV